jgi:hypothetical protein
VKKILDKKILEQEAAFWKEIKKVTKQNPGKICHK